VFADHSAKGDLTPGHRTEIRSRWTDRNLYFLFVCPYEQLYLKPDPKTNTETNELWKWDVAEAFIGSDFIKEGQLAAEALVKAVGGKAKIIELQGTIGSSPANDRMKGFADYIKAHPDMLFCDDQFECCRYPACCFQRRHGHPFALKLVNVTLDFHVD